MFLRTPWDFGAAIRDKRLRLGLTQAALARKAGVGREWLVAAEKGKPGASLALILRTLEALGISLSIDPARRAAKPSRRTPPAVNLGELLNSLRRKKS
jgi:HTH-type transcriptional regulator / antitoxin HipB